MHRLEPGNEDGHAHVRERRPVEQHPRGHAKVVDGEQYRGPRPRAYVLQVCARQLGEDELLVRRVERLCERGGAALAHRLVGGGKGQVACEERREEEDAKGLRQRVVGLQVGGSQPHLVRVRVRVRFRVSVRVSVSVRVRVRFRVRVEG